MTVQFLASALAATVGGTLHGPDVTLDGATIDSRSVAPGALFVPVVAERDGHDFAEGALAAGAGAYLTSRGDVANGPRIEVADTAEALNLLAVAARDRLTPAPVVGVTGSVGKTSVKDLIAAACGATTRTHANPASFNNELGLPLTLANAPGDTEVAVCEMGARGLGHIAHLCRIARPTIAVVTRVASAHTELLGDLDGVAAAKGELVEALGQAGTAVLNHDDPRVLAMAKRTRAAVFTYGHHADADVRITDVTLDALARPTATLESPWGSVTVTVPVSGAHMATNAAAALTVAGIVGVPLEAAAAGIAGATLSAHRMDVTTTPAGALVLDDAYNANPTSMRAAVEALRAVDVNGRRVAVMGVMGELGDDGESEHTAIAAEATAAGIDVIAVGAPAYGDAARHVPDIEGAVAALRAIGDGDAVLVKGSRVAGLERVVARLLGEEAR